MLAIGKIAIRADEFERLFDIMSQIDAHLQCVIVFHED